MSSAAATDAPDERDRRRWLAMPFIALGVAMIIVDATIINVAIPTIIRELDTTATAAERVNSIYSHGVRRPAHHARAGGRHGGATPVVRGGHGVVRSRTPAADYPAFRVAAAGAHPPAAGRPLSDDIARLRKRVGQQEHSLAVMAEAISALRAGRQALRDENRELRLALQATQRSSATTDRSKLRARHRTRDPAPPAPSENELHTRAGIARRELRAPHPQARS